MLELREELGAALANRYVIERELGRGGMAIVYLARDLRHDRRVAIKVLRPELSSSIGAERFLREITIASRLTHPNILSLHDSGDVGGMLYHVMPYVEGESLRQRLERERQLPIDEALAIARQIAAALDYAHEQGVVHRDIKPENILLIGGHALVADFGLARAVTTAATPRLTESGIAVGTPAYISPEQASAEKTIDGRTDVYSLGCVVFEMIAGVPPFRGATAQAVIAHHVSTPAPSLCGERKSCPPGMDVAVRRALSKVPADRYRTAGEFVRALEGAYDGTAPRISSGAVVRQRTWRRPVMVSGIVALVVAVSAAVAIRLARGSTPALNASRVVALPLTLAVGSSSTDQLTRDATQHLSDALGQWSDLRVVDDRTTREAVDAVGHAPLRTEQALALARHMGAGRLVWGDVAATPDSVTIRASLYDVASGTVARDARITYPAHSSLLIQPYRELVNRLLRDRDELPWTKPDETWPASLAAWTAYDSARKALETWDLTTAESRLRDALRIQPEFPQAELWLAQVLSWGTHGRTPEATRRAAEEERLRTTRALSLVNHLTDRDRAVATGLKALAERQFPQACEQFRKIVSTAPNDFPGWYGLGDCLRRDGIVLVDKNSPSGYAFRTGWNSAAAAYEHAVDLVANEPPPFLFVALAQVLIIDPTEYRAGHLESGMAMYSPPILQDDTLAFIPYPSSTRATRVDVDRALHADMDRLGKSLRGWVRRSPREPLAHERLGLLLEQEDLDAPGGEAGMSALEQIGAARELSSDSLHKLALSNTLVRLALKADSFALAAHLADSLLKAVPQPSGDQAQLLVGLAALLGHEHRTAQLLMPLMSFPRYGPSLPDGRQVVLPEAALQLISDAEARAVLGVCDDTLRSFGSHLQKLLISYVPDSAARAAALSAASWRVLSAAVPCLGVGAVAGVDSSDVLVQQQQAFARGGQTAFRVRFNAIQRLRKNLRPGDVAVDYTFHEALLLLASGDTAAAVDHLDRTLDALPTLTIYVLDFPSEAAGLVRAMALRAELAARRGEHARERRWADAVATLLTHADPGMLKRYNELGS